MSSSFVDPTTVRSNLCRRSLSAANQQTSFADNSLCCGNHEARHQQPLQQVSQPMLANVHGRYWPVHDTQPKRQLAPFQETPESMCTNEASAWMSWSNNTWYSQASPGAHGDEHSISTWGNVVPQAYMSPPLSDGEYIQGNQPVIDNWLLQRSYHGAQDTTGHHIPWDYQPVQPHYNHLHQPEYDSHSQSRPSYDSCVDVKYPDTSDGRSENMSASTGHYAFPSPNESHIHETYYTERQDAGVWGWPQSMPDNVHTPLHSNLAIQDLGNTPEHGRVSFFSEPSPSMAKFGAQSSPSAFSDDTTPTDLIPNPPTELIDPPSEDMAPGDKTMIPQRRNLKDPNHLYMPRWIRGDGKQREGWCGACRPGKWLSLKRSTYWCMKISP